MPQGTCDLSTLRGILTIMYDSLIIRPGFIHYYASIHSIRLWQVRLALRVHDRSAHLPDFAA